MKNKIKIISICLLIFTISTLSVFAVEKYEEIKVYFRNINVKLNDKDVKLDEEPFIYNNRIFVPLRFVSEELGCKVFWNDEENTVSISSFTDFPEADYLNGERFVYGEILKINKSNRTITIYQHIDDNSITEDPDLKVSNDVIIIFQRNDKKMNLDFEDLKIGDNIGIVINKNGKARGIIVDN